MPDSPPTFAETRTAWVAHLGRVARRDRWGLALMAIGNVHAASFLGLQLLHRSGDRAGWHYVLAWGVELAAVLGVLRGIAGRGWSATSPLAGLIARIWGTVLILSLSLASLNVLSGLDHEWFKPVLCTLASFGFMMMAYLIRPAFFAGAVWMSLTGALMVNALDLSYLIHGLSWWIALMTLGGILEGKRRSTARRPAEIRVAVPIRHEGGRPRGTRVR